MISFHFWGAKHLQIAGQGKTFFLYKNKSNNNKVAHLSISYEP